MPNKRRRKTWHDKLHDPRPHEVKPVPKDMAGMKAGQKMLIATPQIIERYVRNVPHGETRTMPQMRADLAQEYGAEVTCPITTGIFLRIVAEAAYEDLQAGAQIEEIAPFWRAIDEKAPAARKLACGSAFISEMRAAEAAENG